jgi:hypothetical protein
MVELTVQLHQLDKDGKNDSDEAETLRDESDQYWYNFSEGDKDWLRQFSASLYKLWES